MKTLWSIHKSKEIKSTPLLRSAKNSPKFQKKTERNPETILEIYFWGDIFSFNSWRYLDNLVCPFESNGTINIHFTQATLHLKGNNLHISSHKWGHFCSNAFLFFPHSHHSLGSLRLTKINLSSAVAARDSVPHQKLQWKSRSSAKLQVWQTNEKLWRNVFAEFCIFCWQTLPSSLWVILPSFSWLILCLSKTHKWN